MSSELYYLVGVDPRGEVRTDGNLLLQQCCGRKEKAERKGKTGCPVGG